MQRLRITRVAPGPLVTFAAVIGAVIGLFQMVVTLAGGSERVTAPLGFSLGATFHLVVTLNLPRLGAVVLPLTSAATMAIPSEFL